MSHKTILNGRWVTYPDGVKVYYLNHLIAGNAMQETPPTLNLVYLTLPNSSEPTLNLQLGDQFVKFRVTRDQLLDLNADIADALVRGRQRRLPNGQLDLAFGRTQTEH